MGAGVWLMLSASASYLELGRRHPFFLEKLPLAHPRWWLAALYVHVPSALFALPACLVLTVGRVRRRFPRVHRWLGRVTGALVMIAVVPSGMYLACFARGGLPSTLGFWLTGLITFVAMAKSIENAREGRMRDHRRMSAHVTAQLAVAVVSRFMLAGAEQIDIYGDWVYVGALFVPSSAARSSQSSSPDVACCTSRKDLVMKHSLPCLLWMLCASVALAEPSSAAPTDTQKAASTREEEAPRTAQESRVAPQSVFSRRSCRG